MLFEWWTRSRKTTTKALCVLDCNPSYDSSCYNCSCMVAANFCLHQKGLFSCQITVQCSIISTHTRKRSLFLTSQCFFPVWGPFTTSQRSTTVTLPHNLCLCISACHCASGAQMIVFCFAAAKKGVGCGILECDFSAEFHREISKRCVISYCDGWLSSREPPFFFGRKTCSTIQ